MWRYVKIPKAIALLAFLLPWMTVSCSNTKAAEANGLQLTMGHIVMLGNLGGGEPIEAGVNYYFAAAVVLIVVGLILSFMRKRLTAVVVATSLGALALIYAGANQYTSARIAAAAAKRGDANLDQIAPSLIRIDWQIGYWIALGALAIAAVLAFLAIRDPDTR